MRVAQRITDAGGDVTKAMRTVRCFVCDERLLDVAGDAFRAEIKCRSCNTLIIVQRPMTGELAQRFGIRPQAAAVGAQG